MTSLAHIKSNRPKIRHLLSEGRALFEFGTTSMLMPLLLQAPRGDDHPVIVIPGFLASDISTKPLRSFLKLKGYQPSGWNLGRNLGTHIVGGKHIVSDKLINQVIKAHVKHDRKVSIVGWSLGGILAREIARAIPDCVRQVISLGSPFNGPQGSAPVASKMFELINGDLSKREPHAVAKIIPPPQVPCTAIFSRSDGVAHWKACKNHDEHLHELSENIEVKGSHMGLGHNAQVLWIIANRLAQKEGQWTPFLHKNLHRIVYPNPNRA
ncbi:MAG: alpha/beta hydrolase [Aliiglaciecola sp.]|uniref:PGAP1-like alpha/beta domain-containing protein n=1 Tax=Aliiglaciecola sp. M165 TaxID=2593649 RepID=UPI00117DB7D6|nr:hypothetical protein [Aliiglaciecola sp. M165]TRY30625.1 hypothetical protein FM019_12060 [Aliiglaciecola sp. M165]